MADTDQGDHQPLPQEEQGESLGDIEAQAVINEGGEQPPQQQGGLVRHATTFLIIMQHSILGPMDPDGRQKFKYTVFWLMLFRALQHSSTEAPAMDSLPGPVRQNLGVSACAAASAVQLAASLTTNADGWAILQVGWKAHATAAGAALSGLMMTICLAAAFGLSSDAMTASALAVATTMAILETIRRVRGKQHLSGWQAVAAASVAVWPLVAVGFTVWDGKQDRTTALYVAILMVVVGIFGGMVDTLEELLTKDQDVEPMVALGVTMMWNLPLRALLVVAVRAHTKTKCDDGGYGAMCLGPAVESNAVVLLSVLFVIVYAFAGYYHLKMIYDSSALTTVTAVALAKPLEWLLTAGITLATKGSVNTSALSVVQLVAGCLSAASVIGYFKAPGRDLANHRE